MIPLTLHCSPLACRAWGLEPVMELVLDDGSGVRAVPQAEAAGWIARCLLGAGVASSQQAPAEPGSRLMHSERTEDCEAALSQWIHQWRRLGVAGGPLRAGCEVRLCHPDGLESPLLPLEAGPAGVRLAVLAGPDSGSCLEIPRGRSVLGRAGNLRLQDPAVSRLQAEFTASSSGLRLRTLPGTSALLRSSDGSLSQVRGVPVPLAHGDEIAVGHSRLQVVLDGARPTAAASLQDLLSRLATTDRRSTTGNRRGQESPGSGTLRAFLLWVPLLASVLGAIAMERPGFLLFGLLSLGSAVPATIERIRGRAQRKQQLNDDRQLRRACLRTLFPPPVLAGLGQQPDQTVLLTPRDAESLRAHLGPRILWFGPPRPGIASTAHVLNSGLPDTGGDGLALLRLGSWRPVTKTSGSVPAEAHLEAGLLWTPGMPFSLTVTSSSPPSTLLAMLCAAVLSPTESSRVWVHPEDVPVSALQSSRVSILPQPGFLHLCCAQDCEASAPARVLLTPGSDLQRVPAAPGDSGHEVPGACRSGLSDVPELLCVDHLSEADFGRILAAASAARAPEVSSDVPPPPDDTGLPLEETASCLSSETVVSSTVGARASENTRRSLSLLRDGPHLLTVGTTGCGKTELLTSLILHLSWMHSPGDLRFFLIDFKGGSGFSPLAALPHVDQVLSNLEASEVQRVLLSLTAEIERRERWLANQGHADLRSAQDAKTPGSPPRFVVVVDELKALVDSDPEASTVLARIAALGRSLGIHLVLAAQRAQGAASQELRANISTTVVLRMATAADSRDALGGTQAASISADAPGTLFLQSEGRVEGPYRAGPAGHVLPAERLAATRWPGLPAEIGQGLGIREQTERIRRRWPQEEKHSRWPQPVAPRMPSMCDPNPSGVPLVADDPWRQRLLHISGPRRTALLFGQPGEVLHSSLAGLAVSSLSHRDSPQLICIAESSGIMASLCDVACSWAGPSNPLDVSDLLESLPPPGPDTVLVIVSLDTTAEGLRTAGLSTAEESLAGAIWRTARAGGTVLATTLRDPGRAGAAFESWAYLPLGAGHSVAAAWPRLPSVPSRPGSAHIRGEWQTEEAGPLPLEHSAQFLSPPRRPDASGVTRPRGSSPSNRGFRPLPAVVRAQALPLPPRAATPPRLSLGVDGLGREHSLSLKGLSPFAVLGASGSGRSTVLRMIHQRLGPRSSLLSAQESADSRWLECLDSPSPPRVLLVDDADGLTPQGWDALGQACWRALLIVACPLGPQPRLSRLWSLCGSQPRGVVLSPRSPVDAEPLGRRVAPFTEFSPGVGWLLGEGRDARIRVFLPAGGSDDD